MGSNIKKEAMERVGEVEHHECYYDTDRNKPLPGRAAAPVAGSVKHRAWKRPIYYTDTIKGEQVCRDDLWAVTTDELRAIDGITAGAPSVDRNSVLEEAVKICKTYPRANGTALAEAIQALKYAAPLPVDAAQAVPEGWKLVPIEPTREMYVSACEAFFAWSASIAKSEQYDFTHIDTYRAMLAAAPVVLPLRQEQVRPTDDDLWDQTLLERDTYHDWADKLADAIAAHFGVDIGEHSNQNLPWSEALDAIENSAAPIAQPTDTTKGV